MKPQVWSIFLLLISSSLIAQSDCNPLLDEKSVLKSDYRQSTTNNVSNLMFNLLTPDPFFNGDGSTKLFDLGFARGVWAGGLDPSGNLKVAASGYGDSGYDFIPGPIWENVPDKQVLCDYFDRVWTVERSQVVSLIELYVSGQLQLTDIPRDILEWPAIGNPHITEFQLDQVMAPFYDHDGNGIYDPQQGDYPLALEESTSFVPEQFRFYVFNDNTDHQNSEGSPLEMEFHVLEYVVNCTEQTDSGTSIFTRLKYLHKGNEDLHDFRIGIWDDTDLGCYTNDYIGCDTILNTSYVYNINGTDPAFCDQVPITSIPDDYSVVRSLVFLNQELEGYSYYYNCGVVDPAPEQCDPQRAEHYYNYLNNRWLSGIQMTDGGDALNPGSNDKVEHVFPDFPNQQNGWSMQSEGSIAPALRSLSIFDKEEVLAPGEERVVDFVDHILLSQDFQGLRVFEEYPIHIRTVKQDFEAMQRGTFDCGAFPDPCQTACVWPGDVNDDGYVSGRDLVIMGNYLGLGIDRGPARTILSDLWYPFEAIDWNEGLGTTDAKHADVNGNGTIDFDDLTSIQKNLKESRIGAIPSELLPEDRPGVILSITHLFQDSINLGSANFLERIITPYVDLGVFNSDLLEPVHGLTYQIRFDTNLVLPLDTVLRGSQQFDVNGTYSGPWTRTSDYYFGSNKIDYYLTNISGEEKTSGTLLPRPELFVKDDAVTNNPDGRDTLVLKFYNAFATNATGEEVQLRAVYDSIVISNLQVDPDVISKATEISDSQSYMRLSPNPAHEYVDIHLSTEQSGQLHVYNTQGELMEDVTFQNTRALRLETENYPPACYIVSLRSTDSHYCKQFVKL